MFRLQVSPHKAELIPVPQDEDGIIVPEMLRETLRNRELSGKKMPKIMYINATGLNPTGVVIPLERRKEIYRIACEYNFLILDDDPYFCLYYDDEVINILLPPLSFTPSFSFRPFVVTRIFTLRVETAEKIERETDTSRSGRNARDSEA